MCIDSTHGMTGYGFELTTLMVVDEHEEGLPVAFCCSSKVNTAIMDEFFQGVKMAVGETKAKYFISDDADLFYQAWCGVMGSAKSRLPCSRHVDESVAGKIK